jgi:hypothetical protein
MKFTAAIAFALLFTFLATAQNKIPAGYRPAPTLAISGDFDGNGTPDTLEQFIADSLGSRLDYIIDADVERWDREDYSNAFNLNGKPCKIDNSIAVGLFCLINLGDINSTKGDEIALVPMLLDYSSVNSCSIYSYCNGSWVTVFDFKVNENAFTYTPPLKEPFTNIPHLMEKRNGKWVYIDYLDYMVADDPKLKPLKVANCK